MRRKISIVRALQRSIFGRNSGAGFFSISVQRHAALAERDGERQADRARAYDQDFGVHTNVGTVCPSYRSEMRRPAWSDH